MIRLLVVLMLIAGPIAAVEPDEILADPELEARARALGHEVRCLVCRSESVEESNAEFARDVRLVIRERIEAGDSDADVMAFLTDRFGEYIAMRPRFGGSTLWLWLSGPLLLLIGAAVAVGFVLRGRNDALAALTDAEDAEIARLMAEDALPEER